MQALGVAVADVHGNETQYEKLLKVVVAKGVTAVFMAGDLFPKTGGTWTPDNKVRTVAMQREFIDNFFIPYLKRLGELTKVYAVFGNDDFIENYRYLSTTRIGNVKFLNNQVTRDIINGKTLTVAGYPYVGVTPFLHKDWESRDAAGLSLNHKIYRVDGYIAGVNSMREVNLGDINNNPDTIQGDLRQLAKQSVPSETIYVFHEAPYDTPLDQIAIDNKYIKDGGLHVGSSAVREFIKEYRPKLTLHGHIHETFAESGEFKWNYRKSLSATPANDFSKDELCYLIFNLFGEIRIERLLA